MQNDDEQVRTPEEQLRIFREQLEDRSQFFVGVFLACVLFSVIAFVSLAACVLIN